MKSIRIRRVLIFTAIFGVLGGAGAGIAGPRPQNNSGASKPADRDSVQVTVTASKGRLGVAVLQISSDLRAHLGAPAERGVLVDAVRPDSPAARAGLHVGDVIVEVDGEPTRSATDILGAMSDRKKGDAIKIAVVRDRGRAELTATLEDDPAPHGARGPGAAGGPNLRPWLRDLPELDGFGPGTAELQRQLDDARRRIDELERRLEKLNRR